MLTLKIKKRIKSRKWDKHSNKSEFFKRIKKQSKSAFDDLTLIIEQFENPQLKEIFTDKKMEQLIFALINSRLEKDRKFMIEYSMLTQILEHIEKLIQNELLKDMYNEHKNNLRKIVDSIYDEKQDSLGIQTTLTNVKSKSKP